MYCPICQREYELYSYHLPSLAAPHDRRTTKYNTPDHITQQAQTKPNRADDPQQWTKRQATNVKAVT
jgi:hypothetical protein